MPKSKVRGREELKINLERQEGQIMKDLDFMQSI